METLGGSVCCKNPVIVKPNGGLLTVPRGFVRGSLCLFFSHFCLIGGIMRYTSRTAFIMTLLSLLATLTTRLGWLSGGVKHFAVVAACEAVAKKLLGSIERSIARGIVPSVWENVQEDMFCRFPELTMPGRCSS